MLKIICTAWSPNCLFGKQWWWSVEIVDPISGTSQSMQKTEQKKKIMWIRILFQVLLLVQENGYSYNNSWTTEITCYIIFFLWEFDCKFSIGKLTYLNFRNWSDSRKNRDSRMDIYFCHKFSLRAYTDGKKGRGCWKNRTANSFI